MDTPLDPHTLAARLVDFYKDYDFYHFLDSLNATVEDAIDQTQKILGSRDGVHSFLDAFAEISGEGELTYDQEQEAAALTNSLKEFYQSLSNEEFSQSRKAPLSEQISSASSRTISPDHSLSHKRAEPERNLEV